VINYLPPPILVPLIRENTPFPSNFTMLTPLPMLISTNGKSPPYPEKYSFPVLLLKVKIESFGVSCSSN